MTISGADAALIAQVRMRSISDQSAVAEHLAPKFVAMQHALYARAVKHLHDCAEQLRSGTLKHGTPQFERCTVATALPSVFSRLQVAFVQLNANPARLLTQASSLTYSAEDSREVIDAQRRYGSMPLIVLTAGHHDLSALPPGTPGAATSPELAELRKQSAQFFLDAWGPAHDRYAAMSTRGSNRLVPDSGHDIPSEEPAVVISAVIEVLDRQQTRSCDER